MPLYRYYVSSSPADPSPRDELLSSMGGANLEEAIASLQREGRLPDGWQTLWIHVLVWVDQEGQQRGFESIPLMQFATRDLLQSRSPKAPHGIRSSLQVGGWQDRK